MGVGEMLQSLLAALDMFDFATATEHLLVIFDHLGIVHEGE